MLKILKQCSKEIADFPEDIRGDLADAVARLEEGQMLSLPLSRPMPGIGKGVHELRLKDRSGIYRVIYFLAGKGMIHFLHAFSKKTQQTLPQNIELARKRLREIL